MIGKRSTFLKDDNTRVYAEGKLGARLTGIKNASNINGEMGLFIDQEFSDSTVLRVGVGYKTTFYFDKSQSSKQVKYFKVMVGDETFEGGLRYNFISSILPEYQNALPSDFEGREDLKADEENILEVFIKNKW